MKEIIEMIKVQSDAVNKFGDRFTALETRISELEKATKSRKVEIAGLEHEKQTFSFMKAVAAIRSDDWSRAGFEKEVFEATRQKAMAAGVPSAGGFIVPHIYVTELIEMLRDTSAVIASGATEMSDLQGSPIEIPKQTGGATAFWVGENQDITPSVLTVGQITMTPKAVGALVKLSNRLMNLSNPSAEAMVKRDIAQNLALAVDLAALRGTGTSYQPTGVANTAGINTVTIGTNGGTFNFDTAADMVSELEVDNALFGSLGFIFHPYITRQMKKVRIPQYSTDTGGDWVLLPMSNANLRDALGFNFASTTKIPINLTKGTSTNCSEVYFGNWQELIIGGWGGLEIMASTETSDAFQKNQTWIRVIQEVDIAVRHPESFCLCSDARIAIT